MNEKDQILEKIAASKLREYGVYNEPLIERIERAKKPKTKDVRIAATGLNNEDKDHMLLGILREVPEKVLHGLSILADCIEADTMICYLPIGEEHLGKVVSQTAKGLGIDCEISYGIADMRLLKEGCICHIQTLAYLSDVVNDTFTPGTYLCIQANIDGEMKRLAPQKVAYGTRIRDLTKALWEQTKALEDQVKAVQIGFNLFDEKILDQEITAELNLGNGVITLYDQQCCMIKTAQKELLDNRKQSCGKCTFCREGLGQLYTRIHEITTGKGEWDSLVIMKEIGQAMNHSCACSVGEVGARFLLGTVDHFTSEYADHIKKKSCACGQCMAFIGMYIEPSKCTGCNTCVASCSENCIVGLPGYIYMIEELDCTKCCKCIEVCPEDAIVKTLGRVPKIPDRLTKVGRFKRY